MLTLNFSSLPIEHLQQQLQNTAQYQTLLQVQKSVTVNQPTWAQLKQEWQHLQLKRKTINPDDLLEAENSIEPLEVNWLIQVFGKAFAHHNVILVRGEDEPEYFPATQEKPAQIQFAHGFFRSALHEISHWSLAGPHRRTLSDFGYWYAPDGRTEAQQHEFERVEIKPQAIECLLALLCDKKFDVSQDNLHADFDTSQSTFKQDVFEQATNYINNPNALPGDALTLMVILCCLCRDNIK